jgi:MarR family transcriptional regulator, organic hydroperoxide resistance regulator
MKYSWVQMSSTTTVGRGVSSQAWMLLFEFFKAQKPRFAELTEEFDLSGSQLHALYLLGQPRSMGDLAQRLVCDASNVTGLVDRLETRGLIERKPGPDDRRVRMLVLTPAGEELRTRALAKFTEAPAGIAALTLAEQRTLRGLLRKALDAS